MPRHNSTPELSFASVGQDINSVLSAASITDAATEALGIEKNTAKTIKNVVVAGTIAFFLYQAYKAVNK